MVAQGVLPFRFEADTTKNGLTSYAGLLPYLDLIEAIGLGKSLRERLGGVIRQRRSGFAEAQLVMSLVLMQLAGGEAVSDIRQLAQDRGLCKLMVRAAYPRLGRKERRRLERAVRKGRQSVVPSPSAIFRFLNAFHDEEEMEKREEGTAWIPESTEELKALGLVNRDVVAAAQARSPQRVATLDMDATLVETNKREALRCYKGFRSYQPFNVWWAEQHLVVRSELRDGNVPAQTGYLRILKEELEALPEGVETVRLRSDSAGYQWDLLRYCERGKNTRFGRIEFAVGADVSPELRKAVLGTPESEWHPLGTRDGSTRPGPEQEWAEVCFVPKGAARSRKGRYRYLVIREVVEQPLLPELGEQLQLPFPTAVMGGTQYKVTAVVTNLDWPGESVIHWYRERCGKSEEAHGIMKNDLAGGRLPSGKFGANAAWWGIMILALNLNEVMKRQVLAKVAGGESLTAARLKALRYRLIHVAGRVIEHGRRLVVRIAGDHPSLPLLIGMRARILELAAASPG